MDGGHFQRSVSALPMNHRRSTKRRNSISNMLERTKRQISESSGQVAPIQPIHSRPSAIIPTTRETTEIKKASAARPSRFSSRAISGFRIKPVETLAKRIEPQGNERRSIASAVRAKVNSIRQRDALMRQTKTFSLSTEKIGMHFLTLKFDDEKFEQRFTKHWAKQYRRTYVFASWAYAIFIILEGLGGMIDANILDIVLIACAVVALLLMIYFQLYFLAHRLSLATVLSFVMLSPIIRRGVAGNLQRHLVYTVTNIWYTSIMFSLPAYFSVVVNAILVITTLIFVFSSSDGCDTFVHDGVCRRYADPDIPTGKLFLKGFEYVLWMLFHSAFSWMIGRQLELRLRRDYQLTKRLFAENVQVVMEFENLRLFSKSAQGTRSSFTISKNAIIHRKDIQIGETIGIGAFGDVCRAKHKGATVAAKRLRGRFNNEEAARFATEAVLMLDIRHPNIVMIYGYCANPPMVIMEFMQKGSVRHILDALGQKITPRLHLRFLVDTARGMIALHHHSPMIIHRDLKSLNLLVNDSWTVKVSDFGLSHFTDHQHTTGIEDLARSSRFHGELEELGTILWCAPEVLRGERHSKESDVYAFAIVIWEIVALKLPYADVPLHSVPLAVLDGLRPDHFSNTDQYRKKKGSFLLNLKDVMELCWQEDPSRRPPFEDILDLLLQCGEEKFGEHKWYEKVFQPMDDCEASFHGLDEVNAMDPSSFSITASDLDIGKRIGGGCYGDVYRARFFGTSVAVKQILLKGLPIVTLKSFKKECDIMKSLRHPNVVLFMGNCANPPRLLLVTELMSRGSLFEMIQRKTWEEVVLDGCNSSRCRFAIGLAMDVARGMSYLHGRTPPIVHRDLKSPNILFNDNWVAKVADFGLSDIKEEGRTMTKCGSPLWVAPEIILGQRFGEAADMYSFSIILWEALEWNQPYARKASVEIMRGVAYRNMRPAFTEGGAWTPEIKDFLNRAWDADQHKRPTFKEALQILEPICNEMCISVPTEAMTMC